MIQAMRAGGFLMIDEISLAGDAVLERMNPILETGKKLLVSEKTRLDGEVCEIVASNGFGVLATMNPGGDHGKKEVGPFHMYVHTYVAYILCNSFPRHLETEWLRYGVQLLAPGRVMK